MAVPVHSAPDPHGDLGADGLPVWFPDDDPVDEFGPRLNDEEFAALCAEEDFLARCAQEPDPGSADDEGLPEDCLPDEAVPDEAVPDEAVPDEAVPDEAGAGWAVPGLTPEVHDDALSAASVAALGETTAAVRSLRLAQARCYRAFRGLQGCDAVAETGYRSLTRLLEDHVRLDRTEALRLSRHADSLAATVSPTGTPVPPELPATAGLVDDGTIGPGHVEVIRKTMRRLHAVVPALAGEVLATTETQLAGLATTHSPAALAQATVAILALLDPDGTAPDDDPPPENELHYLRRKDGTLAGRFTYRDPAAAEYLATALAHATPPPEGAALDDPHGPGLSNDGGERGESPDSQALRTLPERRAQALLDLTGEAYHRGIDTTSPEPSTPDDASGPGPQRTAEPQPAGGADASAADTAGSTPGRNADDSAPDRDAEETTAWGLFDPDTDPDEEAGDGPDATEAEPAGRGKPFATPPSWHRNQSEGGERIALTLTVDYETLRRQLGQPTPAFDGTPRLGLLGENTWIRPETARRLACDADLIPAILGTTSEVLDLGRKARIVPPHVRRALYLRDRHCAHPGCRRRPRKCHAHHIEHWIDGGDTAPDNCVLLCTYHHTLVHHSGWEILMVDGLPWFRPPAWLDPTRQLRHNRPWQTVDLSA